MAPIAQYQAASSIARKPRKAFIPSYLPFSPGIPVVLVYRERLSSRLLLPLRRQLINIKVAQGCPTQPYYLPNMEKFVSQNSGSIFVHQKQIWVRMSRFLST